jgi:hypothetical protein
LWLVDIMERTKESTRYRGKPRMRKELSGSDEAGLKEPRPITREKDEKSLFRICKRPPQKRRERENKNEAFSHRVLGRSNGDSLTQLSVDNYICDVCMVTLHACE